MRQAQGHPRLEGVGSVRMCKWQIVRSEVFPKEHLFTEVTAGRRGPPRDPKAPGLDKGGHSHQPLCLKRQEEGAVSLEARRSEPGERKAAVAKPGPSRDGGSWGNSAPLLFRALILLKPPGGPPLHHPENKEITQPL